MNELTEIEKRFAYAMWADPEPPPGIDIYNPKLWPDLRRIIRKTAYHEAGHFAARCFTKLELSHVLVLSIIPKEGDIGRMTYERPFAEQMLPSYSPPLQRSNGRMLLLEHFAGHGTEMILDQSEKWESILDYWEYNYDDFDQEGTDMSRAFHIAEIMAKPYMPVNRILNLADKWALEMLRIPAVWNKIETVAGKLIEQGEITDENEELFDIAYDSNFPSIYNLAKWKQRVLFKPWEMEQFIRHDIEEEYRFK